jgi:hydroxyquinol 1,2-dioxygenase
LTDRPSSRNLSDEALTDAVIESFAGARSDRFREIAEALVRHLHGFVTDVGLTEEEWFAGIDFFTRTGDITDEKRQEFILLSDVLGVSMLVIGVNNRKPAGATEATVIGPFFVAGSPGYDNGDDIANGASGIPCFVRGRVLGADGEPVGGARIEIWQADDEGLYDVQRAELDEAQARGHVFSAADGGFAFWTVRPEAYPIPTDGPVGDLLAAAGRGPMRPAHIHFRVEAPGYETLTTHVFADGDEFLDLDAVFGVKSSLIAPFIDHEPGAASDGSVRDTRFTTMEYDLVLASAESTKKAHDEHGRD